jgi:8-amino-7-oxononanoate synthase
MIANQLDLTFQQHLETIRLKNRYRVLKEPFGIDFSSNDYLGLYDNPILENAFLKGIELYGLGSTASRLIRGHRDVFETTEEKFAHWVGSENSLYLANGFIANISLLDTICDKDTVVFSDRLNHASILDGIRLAGVDCRYYRHLDMNHLEELLKKYEQTKRKIIVSETVFSMDGDLCDTNHLLELKQKYGAVLILDEAHAVGVFGDDGKGLCGDKQNFDEKKLAQIDFRIYTCGKSMGLQGAFIACSTLAKEYFINTMRGFIFSTAPMPALMYALSTSIDLIIGMDKERKKVLELANLFRQKAIDAGYNTLQSKSQIIPVITGTEEKALQLASFLQKKGFDTRAIRPPTVKESRLRVSINAKRTEEEVILLCELLKVKGSSYENFLKTV